MTLLSVGPNWLGSPQHVVGGMALALVVAFVARRFGLHPWVAIALGIGITSAAEIVVELAEYFFTNTHHATAYFDTLADMASTVAGAAIGSLIGAYLPQSLARRG